MLIISVIVVLGRSCGYLQDSSPLTLVLYKLSLACIAFMAAHVAWSQAFFYVDFETMVEKREFVMLNGLSTLRGLIYAAFILGITLGL